MIRSTTRLGEAAGLRLEDVDFLRRTISVRHQLQGETNSTTELVASEFGSERVVYGPTQLIAPPLSTRSAQVSGRATGCSPTPGCR